MNGPELVAVRPAADDAPLEEEFEVAAKRQAPWRMTVRRLFRHRLFLMGLCLCSIILLAGVFAQLITTADPVRLAMRWRFRAPGVDGFVFGTDNFGRSLWARVVFGAQLSLYIGFSVVLLNAVFGTLIGAAAGYFRKLDNALMRVNDAMMACPAILLAIAITAVLGASTFNAILALSIVYIPRTARIVRASVIVLREMEYVQAAVAAGAGHWRILRRHILPNAMAPLIVQLSFLFAYAVLSEATLSFLGLGAVPPTPTWGNMLRDAVGFLDHSPWMAWFPGMAIFATVLGFNLLGDGLRDRLDPRAARGA